MYSIYYTLILKHIILNKYIKLIISYMLYNLKILNHHIIL